MSVRENKKIFNPVSRVVARNSEDLRHVDFSQVFVKHKHVLIYDLLKRKFDLLVA